MLILPPGHGQATRQRSLSARERRLIGAVLALVGALIVALVISLASAGRTSARGCIYVTIPAPTGAQEIDRCGAAARATCRAAETPGAFTAPAAQTVAAACRKANLAVG